MQFMIFLSAVLIGAMFFKLNRMRGDAGGEEGSNVWVMSSVLNGGVTAAAVYCAGGSKELSAELTQLSFSTDGVFDNGNVNILVEG